MDRSQEIIRTSWIGIIANVLLAGFKAAVGILANSVAIVMDALPALTRCLMPSLRAGNTYFGWCYAAVGHVADGILGALISIVIIKAGIEMLASFVNELLGTSISAELTKQIIKEVSDFEGVHGVFDLILHNYGPDVKIGSLHINVYDTMSAHEIHGLTRKITMQMIERHGIIMTVGDHMQ